MLAWLSLCIGDFHLGPFPSSPVTGHTPDARVWVLGAVAGFATGKTAGKEERVPNERIGYHGLAPASFDLSHKGLPIEQVPHTQGPQDPWGGVMSGPGSIRGSSLSPRAVDQMLRNSRRTFPDSCPLLQAFPTLKQDLLRT